MNQSEPEQGARILIADDSVTSRRLITRILEAEGHQVTAVGNGIEAVRACYEQRPDLVVLDLTMPHLNGYQACRLLKNDPALAEVPIVLLTGSERAADRFWGLKTGADAYLTKADAASALPEAAASLLAKARAQTGERDATLAAERVTEESLLSRVAELLDHQLFEATVMNDLSALTALREQYDDTVKAVLRLMGNLFDHRATALLLVNPDKDASSVELYVHKARPATEAFVDGLIARTIGDLEDWAAPSLMTSIEPVIWDDTDPEQGVAPADVMMGYRGVPIRRGDATVGVLALASSRSLVVGKEAAHLLRRIASQAYLVIENARLYREVHRSAITDGLTGLYNRRYIEELLHHEVQRSARYGSSLSVLLIDVDNFKQINDGFGHAAGDAVLQRLAGSLRVGVRSADVIGRYGGEEILVVLPQTPPERALRTAERLLEIVRALTFRTADAEFRVTISIGVSGWQEVPADREEQSLLVRRADRALYEAKRMGRDRVRMWTPE